MLFSSDPSAGTGRVIEPPGDARANMLQGADGGCVEVGAALARVRGHAGRVPVDAHQALPATVTLDCPSARSSPSVATLARVGRFQEHRIRRSVRLRSRGRLGHHPHITG